MEETTIKFLAIFLTVVLFMYSVVSFMYKENDPGNSKVTLETGMKGLLYLVGSVYMAAIIFF